MQYLGSSESSSFRPNFNPLAEGNLPTTNFQYPLVPAVQILIHDMFMDLGMSVISVFPSKSGIFTDSSVSLRFSTRSNISIYAEIRRFNLFFDIALAQSSRTLQWNSLILEEILIFSLRYSTSTPNPSVFTRNIKDLTKLSFRPCPPDGISYPSFDICSKVYTFLIWRGYGRRVYFYLFKSHIRHPSNSAHHFPFCLRQW